MVSRIKVASLAAVGLLAGSLAQAEGAYRYSGIAMGATAIDVDNTDFDESDIGFKWFGGLMATENFGLELAYIYGGTIDSNSSALRSVETNAFTLEAVAQVPLGEKFSVFAKAGIAFYDAYAISRAGFSYANSDEDFTYGVGGNFWVNPRFALRLEWEQVPFSTSQFDGDFSMLSLGIAYKF